MDLKALKEKRDARMQAKREAIRAQAPSVEPEAAPEAPAVEEKK